MLESTQKNKIDEKKEETALSIIERLQDNYPESMQTDGMCLTYVYRTKEAGVTRGMELLEKREGLIDYGEDEIGRKYGDGHYHLAFAVYVLNENGKKVRKGWEKYNFSLGESYAKFRNEARREEQLKDLEANILAGKMVNGGNSELIPIFLEMMKQQKEDQNKMFQLLIAQQNKSQNNQFDIVGLIGALAPLLQNLIPQKDDSFKELLLAQLNEKNETSKEMFNMAKESFELGKMISGNSPEEKTMTETIIDSIPAIAEGVRPLVEGFLAKRSIPTAKKIAAPKLKKFQPQIAQLKQDPEAMKLLEKEMGKHYSFEQIERAKKITGLDTEISGVQVL